MSKPSRENDKQKTLGLIGIGGCGNNILDKVVQKWDPQGDNFHFNVCPINTDQDLLSDYFSPENAKGGRQKRVLKWMESRRLMVLKIGKSGMGAGCKPNVAKEAAREAEKDIENFLKPDGIPLDHVILTGGLGKGTGTGVIPYVAQLCKEMEIDARAVVTMPFERLEGQVPLNVAEKALDELIAIIPTIVIKNSKMKNLDIEWNKAFEEVDNACILPLLEELGHVITRTNLQMNVDLNDHRTLHEVGKFQVVSFATWEKDQTLEQVIATLKESPYQDGEIWASVGMMIAHFHGGINRDDRRPWLVSESMNIVEAFGKLIHPPLRENLRVIPGISSCEGPKRVVLIGNSKVQPNNDRMLAGTPLPVLPVETEEDTPFHLPIPITPGPVLVAVPEIPPEVFLMERTATLILPLKPSGNKRPLKVTEEVAKQYEDLRRKQYVPPEDWEEIFCRIEHMTGEELFRTNEHELSLRSMRSKGA
jgi:cell division GTPase FtsZ